MSTIYNYYWFLSKNLSPFHSFSVWNSHNFHQLHQKFQQKHSNHGNIFNHFNQENTHFPWEFEVLPLFLACEARVVLHGCWTTWRLAKQLKELPGAKKNTRNRMCWGGFFLSFCLFFLNQWRMNVNNNILGKVSCCWNIIGGRFFEDDIVMKGWNWRLDLVDIWGGSRFLDRESWRKAFLLLVFGVANLQREKRRIQTKDIHIRAVDISG